MTTEDKSRRKVWSLHEIKGLLKCYSARRKEFIHRRKKRVAYAHVLEDMLAQGYTDSSTTILALENKMRTLYASYRCVKDNVGKPVPYMDELEEIFGDSAPVAVSVASPGIISDSSPVAASAASPIAVSVVAPVASAIANDSNKGNNTVSLGIPKTQRHKKNARDSYYTEKIKLKMRIAEKKLEEKRRFHNKVIETLRDIELKKLELLKESLKNDSTA